MCDWLSHIMRFSGWIHIYSNHAFLRPFVSHTIRFTDHSLLRPFVSRTMHFTDHSSLGPCVSQTIRFSDHAFHRPFVSWTIRFSDSASAESLSNSRFGPRNEWSEKRMVWETRNWCHILLHKYLTLEFDGNLRGVKYLSCYIQFLTLFIPYLRLDLLSYKNDTWHIFAYYPQLLFKTGKTKLCLSKLSVVFSLSELRILAKLNLRLGLKWVKEMIRLW